jgi:hypothetical protein
MFTFMILTAVGMYIVLWKIGVFKLFKIRETRRATDGGLDAAMTFGLVAMFAGTMSGMLIAMGSGLMLSGLLFLTRSFIKPTKSIGGTLDGITRRFRKVPSLLRRAPNH